MASDQDVRDEFVRRFGRTPQVVASAPGRVNLIGEHTDYNGGEVLPIAIAQRTHVAVRRARGHRSRAATAARPSVGEFDHRTAVRSGEWWDYVVGVARELDAAGVAIPPFEIVVVSDVPAGAGLSSSAALEVAAGSALLALVGAEMPIRELALLAQRAEMAFVGVACGIMDQFASALGREHHALHVWCDTAEFEHVPIRDAVLVFDTRVARELRGSAFNRRRYECEQALALLRRAEPSLPHLAAATPDQIRAAALPEPLDRRALHVSEETRRVGETVRALRAGETLPGELLLASHDSLRTQYECSAPELDWFVEQALRHPGVRGARLTGAGWGGCAIAMGTPEALAQAAPALRDDYRAAFGREPGAWISTASAGVEVRTA